MKTSRLYEYLPITLFIALSLASGLFVLGDYGESWDEANIVKYAAHSLENYTLLFQGKPSVDFMSGHLDHYGPAFFIGVMAFSNLARALAGGLNLVESWHLAYFIAFEASIVFLYLLARRFFGQWASFGAAILYGSQPLLWGHAFINPKDIPFLALFLAAVVLGLWMVDRVSTFFPAVDRIGAAGVTSAWRQLKPPARNILLGAWLAVLGLGAVLATQVTDGIVDRVITSLYNASPDSFWGGIFARSAAQASQIPVDRYVLKAQILIERAVFVAWIAVFCAAIWLLIRNLTPLQNLPRAQILAMAWKATKTPVVLASSLALGLTVSTRVLGPYAFLIVAIYAVYVLRERAGLLLGPYLIISAVITYATWPYLWGDPLFRYADSLAKMSDFPWSGDLLFAGALVSSTTLPWDYLPRLMALQLTEPVVLLFLPGLVLSIVWFVQKKEKLLLPLMLIWFILPVGAIILKRSTLYDNFRHILFLLPPVFLASGIVLEVFFQHFQRFAIRLVVLLVVLLPSIQALVALHPYQYTYYNLLVGGMPGAFRIYEMDYWLTSFHEMALFLNEHAQPGANVLVFGPANLLESALREDIAVFESLSPEDVQPDYAVVPARKNDDQLGCRMAPVIFTVEREGAILGVIKAPNAPGQCP